MVARSFTIEVESPLEAKRLWNSTKDMHNCLPKHAPAFISGTTLLEGDGGDGTIRQVNITEGKHFAHYKCNIVPMPKHAPAFISGTTLLEGDGGVGTIRQVNFTEANKDYSYAKEKVDLIDEANMVYGFNHVEGGAVGTKVAYINFNVKITPKEGGGCISTTTVSYDTLPGVPHDEAKVEEVKASSIALFRMLEETLIANPSLYS